MSEFLSCRVPKSCSLPRLQRFVRLYIFAFESECLLCGHEIEKTGLSCPWGMKTLASSLVATRHSAFLLPCFTLGLLTELGAHSSTRGFGPTRAVSVSGVSRHYTGLMIWSVGMNASFKCLLKSCCHLPHPLWLSVGSCPAIDASVSWVAGSLWCWQMGSVPGVHLWHSSVVQGGWNWPKLYNRPVSRLFRKPYWPSVQEP